MEKSKLVILLRGLNAWDLRNVREMVASPYFNKQKVVVQLYALLEKVIKKDGVVPEMEAIFKKLFPKLPYNHQKLRYIMTDLTRIIEEFFVQKELKANAVLQGRLLLESYAAKKHEKYFTATLEKNLKRLDQAGIRDRDFLYEQIKTQEISLAFEADRKIKTGQDWLHAILENLDTFHSATRLRFVCDLVSRSNGNLEGEDKDLVNSLRQNIGKSEAFGSPAIEIYETVLAMLTNADPELYYRKLRMQLEALGKHFQRQELKELYAFALSFSIAKLQQGQSDYLREIFTLYQEQLEGKILYEDETLPLQHFKNIATVGLRLKEFEWTRKFIAEKSEDLPEESREGALKYNNAALFFVTRDYSACRDLLRDAQFVDAFYSMDANSLLLKSYYELKQFEEVVTHSEKFLALIHRSSTLSENQSRPYANLASLTRRLAEIKLGSRNPIGALIGEIQAEREVADMRWLRAKVDEAGRAV